MTNGRKKKRKDVPHSVIENQVKSAAARPELQEMAKTMANILAYVDGPAAKRPKEWSDTSLLSKAIIEICDLNEEASEQRLKLPQAKKILASKPFDFTWVSGIYHRAQLFCKRHDVAPGLIEELDDHYKTIKLIFKPDKATLVTKTVVEVIETDIPLCGWEYIISDSPGEVYDYEFSECYQSLFGPVADAHPEQSQRLNQAVMQYSKGDYDQALLILADIHRDVWVPKFLRVVALIQHAYILESIGDPDAAINLLNEYLSREPNHDVIEAQVIIYRKYNPEERVKLFLLDKIKQARSRGRLDLHALFCSCIPEGWPEISSEPGIALSFEVNLAAANLAKLRISDQDLTRVVAILLVHISSIGTNLTVEELLNNAEIGQNPDKIQAILFIGLRYILSNEEAKIDERYLMFKYKTDELFELLEQEASLNRDRYAYAAYLVMGIHFSLDQLEKTLVYATRVIRSTGYLNGITSCVLRLYAIISSVASHLALNRKDEIYAYIVSNVSRYDISQVVENSPMWRLCYFSERKVLNTLIEEYSHFKEQSNFYYSDETIDKLCANYLDLYFNQMDEELKNLHSQGELLHIAVDTIKEVRNRYSMDGL